MPLLPFHNYSEKSSPAFGMPIDMLEEDGL